MTRRLLFSLALSSLTACNAILGVDFEGRRRDSSDGVDGGEEMPPEGEEGDASTPKEGGTSKDGSLEAAVEGGYLADLEKLAKLRVRVADAPAGLDKHFASRSWMHWVDGAGHGHSLKPQDGTTRNIAKSFLDANDIVALHRLTPPADLSIISGTDGQVLGTFHVSYPVALDDGVLVFEDGAPGMLEARVWRTSSPTMLGASIGTVPSTVYPIGKTGNTAYLRQFSVPPKLFIVDIQTPSVTSIDFNVELQAVSKITEGMVLTHVTGGTKFQLVRPTGVPVNLTAEIAAAKSNIPIADRLAYGAAATSGDWLFYSAQCGILAFRYRDRRLVPIQLRTSEDDFFYNGVRVVQSPRTVIFTSAKSLEGLWHVKVDSLLPP